MVKCGIVGLPNVGKSTLFNALLKKQVAASANYPFTTIEPNVGVVEVPDEKLVKLAEVIAASSNKQPPIVYATVQFVDIAGLVKGAHKGEGLGNQFLSHIREVDAIVFVVRDFKNEDIIKTGENPEEDLEVLKAELLLKDLETINHRLETLNKDKSFKSKEVYEKTRILIEQGKWLSGEMTDEELEDIKDLQLLSTKKYLVVINSDEEELTKKAGNEIKISAKMEEELAGLSPDEQQEYLKELGVEQSGLETLAAAAYKLLELETYYTAGEKEVRAWTIRMGSLAPQAAGVIHTDFERGFIAADIVPIEKFIEVGGWKGSREKGYVRTIGRSELMPSDSVVEFKFSV